MDIASSLPTSILHDTASLCQAFITSGESRGLSKHTLRWYKGILDRFTTDYPELPLTPEPLEQFIGHYTGDERRHGAFRVLRTFYFFTCDRLEVNNPIRKVKPPQRKHKEKMALSLEQLKALLEYTGHNPMTRALLYLLVDTGMRIGEAAGITGKDITEDTIKIDGKTGQRIIPISPQVYDSLHNITPISTAKEQRLFPYSRFWLGRLVTRSMKAVGIERFSAHSLRHTFCSTFSGTDTALKYITGHRSWTMVEHYKHRKEAQAAEQHREHSPLAQMNGPLGKVAQRQPTSEFRRRSTDHSLLYLAEQIGELKQRISVIEQELKQRIIVN